jgi:hypothetical protein
MKVLAQIIIVNTNAHTFVNIKLCEWVRGNADCEESMTLGEGPYHGEDDDSVFCAETNLNYFTSQEPAPGPRCRRGPPDS